MKNLYESLLDDFDTLSDNQDKTFKDPFAYLFYNSTNSNNWDGTLKEFEEVIKLGSKEDHKNIRDYYGLQQKNPLKKGQVQVWISNSLIRGYSDRIMVFFSDTDLKPMRDEGCIGDGKYIITLYFSFKIGRPMISVSTGLPSIDCVKKRYILSKELSKSAINMVKLIAKGEWRNYWEKL
jgi:hypothetical protein